MSKSRRLHNTQSGTHIALCFSERAAPPRAPEAPRVSEAPRAPETTVEQETITTVYEETQKFSKLAAYLS